MRAVDFIKGASYPGGIRHTDCSEQRKEMVSSGWSRKIDLIGTHGTLLFETPRWPANQGMMSFRAFFCFPHPFHGRMLIGSVNPQRSACPPGEVCGKEK